MHKELTKKSIHALPKISAASFSMFLIVAIANLAQTSLPQWSTRPNIACDHGNSVHRYAEVNADRVNIRDLPTVFSNVLTQKNRPDKVIIVCEFGVWSRIDLSEMNSETWISRGLISLTSDQPITIRMKGVFLGLLFFGAAGLMLCLFRPDWITRAIDFYLQTQTLPAHARPLISVRPEYHPARDTHPH
jgi:hypothetical protein